MYKLYSLQLNSFDKTMLFANYCCIETSHTIEYIDKRWQRSASFYTLNIKRYMIGEHQR